MHSSTSVPGGLSQLCDNVDKLKAVLRHFFTYNDGGTYYPRWANPSGAHDPNVADQLNAAYKQQNVREVRSSEVRSIFTLYSTEPAAAGGGSGQVDLSRGRDPLRRDR